MENIKFLDLNVQFFYKNASKAHKKNSGQKKKENFHWFCFINLLKLICFLEIVKNFLCHVLHLLDGGLM